MAIPETTRALTSYADDLTFDDLFEDVHAYNIIRGKVPAVAGTRGYSFVHDDRGLTAWAAPKPGSVAAGAAWRMSGGASRPASFDIHPWPGDYSLVIANHPGFIFTEWVCFIRTDSIPDPVQEPRHREGA